MIENCRFASWISTSYWQYRLFIWIVKSNIIRSHRTISSRRISVRTMRIFIKVFSPLNSHFFNLHIDYILYDCNLFLCWFRFIYSQIERVDRLKRKPELDLCWIGNFPTIEINRLRVRNRRIRRLHWWILAFFELFVYEKGFEINIRNYYFSYFSLLISTELPESLSSKAIFE